MFDLFKNILDSDKSYMQNEETLQGWIFMNHLALLAVYKIYHILQDKQLITKYSIRDFIQHLLEIRAVKINDSWYNAEIINATSKFLEKIGLEQKPIT
jgi:ABC-type lipoprotein export system ATPase subunit